MNQNQKNPAIEPHKIFSILRQMIDRDYIFKGGRIKIGEISEVEEGFYVMTSLKNYTMTAEAANSFIAECFAVENILPQAANITAPQVQIITKQDEMIDDMTNALFHVFKNISTHPTRENIEQATTLSNTANTIANMLKLKLQAQKLIKK